MPGWAAESDGAGTDAREPWAAGYYTLLQDVASVVSTSRGLIFSGPTFLASFLPLDKQPRNKALPKCSEEKKIEVKHRTSDRK